MPETVFSHGNTHTHSVHKVVDKFKEQTKLQLRCFRIQDINDTLEGDEESVIATESKPPRRFVPLPDEIV